RRGENRAHDRPHRRPEGAPQGREARTGEGQGNAQGQGGSQGQAEGQGQVIASGLPTARLTGDANRSTEAPPVVVSVEIFSPPQSPATVVPPASPSSSRKRWSTRHFATRTAPGLRPSSSATSGAGCPSTAVRQNACQVRSANSGRMNSSAL